MSYYEHKIGVCGEHGGDPASIRFFDELGLDYISCSPYRVPTAKIAAAQAHIEAVNRKLNIINVALQSTMHCVCMYSHLLYNAHTSFNSSCV
jgi:phosphoenolpyruvate-protein kinase (PTS system EI component)